MKKIRNIVTFAWLGMGMTIIYAIFLVSTNHPRIQDGDLTVGEMNILEAAIFIFSWFTMYIFWFYTIFKAYESRRFGWLFFTFVLWPLYPIYLLAFASEAEKHEN